MIKNIVFDIMFNMDVAALAESLRSLGVEW